jgi:hypothetical protein
MFCVSTKSAALIKVLVAAVVLPVYEYGKLPSVALISPVPSLIIRATKRLFN